MHTRPERARDQVHPSTGNRETLSTPLHGACCGRIGIHWPCHPRHARPKGLTTLVIRGPFSAFYAAAGMTQQPAPGAMLRAGCSL